VPRERQALRVLLVLRAIQVLRVLLVLRERQVLKGLKVKDLVFLQMLIL